MYKVELTNGKVSEFSPRKVRKSRDKIRCFVLEDSGKFRRPANDARRPARKMRIKLRSLFF